MSYFPEPYTYIKKKIKVELDLLNYAAKSNLKNTTGVDTSKFTKKTGLAILKLDIDKLDIGKLETVSIDLSKLSHVVKTDVAKETVYHELVKNFNAIQATNTSDLVKKS